MMLIRLNKPDKKYTTNSRLCVGHPEQPFLSPSSKITWRLKKEIRNFLLNNSRFSSLLIIKLCLILLISLLKKLTLYIKCSSNRSFIPAYNSLQQLLWRQEISQKISTRIYIHVRTFYIHLITVIYTDSIFPFNCFENIDLLTSV